MRTVEDQAYSLGQLVSCEQSVRLYDLALTMNPLGLHRVEPRALFGQKAAYDPHSTAAVFDLTVVRSEPLPDLFGDVPGSVVPDQNPNLLARRLQLLAASGSTTTESGWLWSSRASHPRSAPTPSRTLAHKARSRRWPSDRGRLFRPIAPPGAGARPLRSNCPERVAPGG
jgi:hypothetical protein